VSASAFALQTGDPDAVTIQIGSTQYSPWQNVSITRSCETMPNSFSVTGAASFLNGSGAADTTPGQACNVYLGTDLVITGWIDRRRIALSSREHSVTISGRGLTRNLVDCSADLISDPNLVGGQINAANTLDLAQRLAKPFKLTARSIPANHGLPITGIQVGLGETPYQIIESAARYAGFLVYEDEKGALVLDQVGTQSMASGFKVPGNIEQISAERSVDGRFSDYMVVWNTVDQLHDLGALTNRRALVSDPTLKNTEYRPRIIVSEQITPAYDVGVARANWELARRLGRSQAATLTCDSWRDSAGKLWTPNYLAPIDAPDADIAGDAKWLIGTVTFRKDLSGTHADLVLMPPDAFTPEPNPLNLFDNILARSPSASQSPTPPTTAAPALGTPPT